MSSSAKAIQLVDASSVKKLVASAAAFDLQSAMKELIENSLDAGATEVEILTKDYGTTEVEVRDNGRGMCADDLQLIARQHATSKLEQFEDLESNKTFGFRGEALFAINELSEKMKIETRTKDSTTTSILQLYSGAEKEASRKVTTHSASSSFHTVGTRITICSFLQPFPVRRKVFVAKKKTEHNKCIQVIRAYAILRTGVSFRLWHQRDSSSKSTKVLETHKNDSVLLNFGDIYGKPLMSDMQTFSLDLNTVLKIPKVNDDQDDCCEFSSMRDGTIEGLISCVGAKSVLSATASQRQLVYVNSRLVTLPKFIRLANKLYREQTSHKRAIPSLILMLTIPRPGSIDYNISADKRMVLFRPNHDRIMDRLLLELGTYWQRLLVANGGSQLLSSSPSAKSLSSSSSSSSGSSLREFFKPSLLFMDEDTKELDDDTAQNNNNDDNDDDDTATNDVNDDQSEQSRENSDHISKKHRLQHAKERGKEQKLSIRSSSSLSASASLSLSSYSFPSTATIISSTTDDDDEPTIMQYKDVEDLSNLECASSSTTSSLSCAASTSTDPIASSFFSASFCSCALSSSTASCPSSSVSEHSFPPVPPRTTPAKRSFASFFGAKNALSMSSCCVSASSLSTSLSSSSSSSSSSPSSSSSSSSSSSQTQLQSLPLSSTSSKPLARAHSLAESASQNSDTAKTAVVRRSESDTSRYRPQRSVPPHAPHSFFSLDSNKQSFFHRPSFSAQICRQYASSSAFSSSSSSSSSSSLSSFSSSSTSIGSSLSASLLRSVSDPTSSSSPVPDIAFEKVVQLKDEFKRMRVIGQCNKTFILTVVDDHLLYILDQHACDERYNLEMLQRRQAAAYRASQQQKRLKIENTSCSTLSSLSSSSSSSSSSSLSSISSSSSSSSVPSSFSSSDQDRLVFKMHTLLRPQLVRLSDEELAIWSKYRSLFEENGFRFRLAPPSASSVTIDKNASEEKEKEKTDDVADSESQLWLTAVPSARSRMFGAGDVVEICASLLHEEDESGGYVQQPKALTAVFASRACRSAIMAGDTLDMNEMKRLVSHLGDLDLPFRCAHGRPSMCFLCDTRKLDLARKRKLPSESANSSDQ